MAKPTKTYNKTIDLEMPTSKGQLSKVDSRVQQVPGTVASASDTAKSIAAHSKGAMSNPAISKFMQRVLASKMKDKVVDDDDLDNPYTRPEPRTPDNLPAVISKAVAQTDGRFNVKWHQVKNLPGYFQSAIRAMGRAVFEPVTKTRIENIYVISSLSNTETELRMLGSWIAKHGHKNDSMEMKFHDLLPGYNAKVDVYAAYGYTFAVVEDQFGRYIYGWDETDNRIGRTSTKQISESVNTKPKIHPAFTNILKNPKAKIEDHPRERKQMIMGLWHEEDYDEYTHNPQLLKKVLLEHSLEVIRRFHVFFNKDTLPVWKIFEASKGQSYFVFFDIPQNKQDEVMEVFHTEGEGAPWFRYVPSHYSGMKVL